MLLIKSHAQRNSYEHNSSLPFPPTSSNAHTCPYMLHMYIYYLCYNYGGRGSNHVRSCQQSKDMDQQFCHLQRVVQGHSPALLPRYPATPLPRACVHYSRTYVARTGVHVHDPHTLLYALSTLCYVIRRGINVPETSAAVEEINTCTVKPLECIT